MSDPAETGAAAYRQPAGDDGAGPDSLRRSSDEVTAGGTPVLEDDAADEPGADRFRSGRAIRVAPAPPNGVERFVLAERTIPG